MKNDLWFQKWHKEFDEFSQKEFKLMLDKSSVSNVLAEEMYFLDKSSPSNFKFFDFPLLVRSLQCLSGLSNVCRNSSCDFLNQESVLYKLCTIL